MSCVIEALGFDRWPPGMTEHDRRCARRFVERIEADGYYLKAYRGHVLIGPSRRLTRSMCVTARTFRPAIVEFLEKREAASA